MEVHYFQKMRINLFRYATVSQNLVSYRDIYGAVYQTCTNMWVYKISTQFCEYFWRDFHYPAICKTSDEGILEVWLDFQKIRNTGISLEQFRKVSSQWGNSWVRAWINVWNIWFFRRYSCKQGDNKKEGAGLISNFLFFV